MVKSRVVAIDYGLKRIGIAYSDETKMIASPYMTMQAETKFDRTVDKLLRQLETFKKERECDIEMIIVGMPYMMSGRMGVLADESKLLIAALKEKVEIPVIEWDERLTTVQAERMLKTALSRKKRTKVVDQVSAVILLQSYLDSIGNGD